jgi:hypothetical protein
MAITSKFKNPAQVRDAMLDKLEMSGLNEDDAKKLGMKPCTAQASPQELDVHKAGFLIPYFDLKGRVTKFWRYRYLETAKEGWDKLTDKKDRRYSQAPKTLNEFYLPSLVNWRDLAKDASKPLCITEGELKAACGCKYGFPTIGLGGVWNWKSTKNKLTTLPQFDEFEWLGRVVYICYDSDARTNPMVIAAENALAKELLNRGAQTFIVRIPTPLAQGGKAGMDDFIVSEGVEAFRNLLEEATLFEMAEELLKLNEEVIYISNPGLIINRDTHARISPHSFVNHTYANRKFVIHVPTGKKGEMKSIEKSAPKEWIEWPLRSEAQCMTFAPGKGIITERGEYNTWRNWGCRPAEGSVVPFKQLLDFIFREAEPEARRWFEQWLAYPLQHPGTKLLSSVLLWGRVHGTGKSLIGYTMFKIYGDNATEISERDLLSAHNEWAENRQFVMGDEITGGDKRHAADKMKSMITQKQLRLNPKFVASYTVPDCINYFFTSNHPDAFFVEDTDRRFFIHEVRGNPLPSEFYQSYMKWLDGSGPSALFHYLLALPMDGFNPQGHAPMTLSKQEMIEDGRSDVMSWVDRLKAAPDMVLRLGDEILRYELWTTSELLGIYDPTGNKKITSNGIGRALRSAGFHRVYRGMPVPTKDGPQKLWAIRNALKLEAIENGPALGQIYNHEREGKTRESKARIKKF